MLTRFCMGQQLRAILSLESIPPEASDLITKCDQIFKTDIRGTFSNDTLAFDASFNTEEEKMSWTQSDLVHLSKDELALLERWWSTHGHNLSGKLSPYAYRRPSIRRLGEVLSTEATSNRNSHILYRTQSGVAAGSIKSIFSSTSKAEDGHQVITTFLIVQQFIEPANHPQNAIHLLFPEVGMRLVLNKLQPEEVLITGADIVSQFTFATVLDEGDPGNEFLYLQALDKVISFTLICLAINIDGIDPPLKD